MSAKMSITQLTQELQTRFDVILSTVAGTTYGIYEAHTSNNIGASLISFMIDTSLHLTQGSLVGIGTYITVHYFKKFFHKKQTK